MLRDACKRSQEREWLDPRHIGHAAQSVFVEHGIGRGRVGRKEHVKAPAFSNLRDFDKPRDVNTGIRLRVRVAPRRKMMSCRPQEHAEFDLLFVSHNSFRPQRLWGARASSIPDV